MISFSKIVFEIKLLLLRKNNGTITTLHEQGTNMKITFRQLNSLNCCELLYFEISFVLVYLSLQKKKFILSPFREEMNHKQRANKKLSKEESTNCVRKLVRI